MVARAYFFGVQYMDCASLLRVSSSSTEMLQQQSQTKPSHFENSVWLIFRQDNVLFPIRPESGLSERSSVREILQEEFTCLDETRDPDACIESALRGRTTGLALFRRRDVHSFDGVASPFVPDFSLNAKCFWIHTAQS